MTRAAERELAALARRLPMFVGEETAGELLGMSDRNVRHKIGHGDLVRGAPGTVTRVSLLSYLASQQGLELDDLELVLEALEEPLSPFGDRLGVPTTPERRPT